MKFIPIIFIALIPTFVSADDLITTDIIGGCGDVYSYSAEFEPISYTCSSGQYLPAGAISCEVCPNTHTCNGGTYTFDANHTQGLSDGDMLVTDAIGSCSTAFTQNYGAIFEPITYTCSPGYYLPAGNDWTTDDQGCTICPADNYCVGGTYTFNETVDQGITPCPVEHPYAPISMWTVTQCGRILHIGDEVVYLKSEKLTVPSLNIGINGEIFYANMTTVPTYMNKDSERYLKIQYDNTVYYVCDDTVYGK